jgi:hypothetical protein
MATDKKNAKLDCFYCPSNSDIKIASTNLLKHTLSKHFDAFLCGTNKTSENNRKALKDATKYNPVELKLHTPIYNCCLNPKCNNAVVNEARCRHYHFNPDEPAKCHKTEHLQGCKDLLQKALKRMDELKGIAAPEPVAEPTNAIVEKIVYRDRVVEKIVYKDRDLGLSEDKKDSITDILFAFNSILEKEQICNKVIQLYVKDIAGLKKELMLKQIMIEKLGNDLKSGAKYDPQKLLEWEEDFKETTKVDEKTVQNKLDSYIETIKYDLDTKEQWDEYSNELKKLGVYDDMMSLIS